MEKTSFKVGTRKMGSEGNCQNELEWHFTFENCFLWWDNVKSSEAD